MWALELFSPGKFWVPKNWVPEKLSPGKYESRKNRVPKNMSPEKTESRLLTSTFFEMEGSRRKLEKFEQGPNGPNGRMVSTADTSRTGTLDSLNPTLKRIRILVPRAWLAQDLWLAEVARLALEISSGWLRDARLAFGIPDWLGLARLAFRDC